MAKESLSQKTKNRRLGAVLGLGALFMVGLSFASVPLYGLFCKVTGLGGKAVQAQALPDAALGREITVRLNTDVAPGLPWDFKGETQALKVKIGDIHQLHYAVTNRSNADGIGVSVYNVQPTRAGLYFNKVQCFCFDEMPLKAGETNTPVVQFFIDPAFAKDPELRDVNTITLSYTFFSSKHPRLAEAKKKFEGEQQRLLEITKSLPN